MFKRTKYGAKKTIRRGIKFDSRVEAEYNDYLEVSLKKKEIHSFERQPKFLLQEAFIKGDKKYRPIYYIADFSVELLSGECIVVDIKGLPTQEAKLKRKMFDRVYPYLTLQWIVKHKGQRVQYEDNQKRIKENKKNKKALDF